MSYGKTCEHKAGCAVSSVTADNQELLVPAAGAPRPRQQLLLPVAPAPQTAFPVLLLQVCSEGLCREENIAELRYRGRSFLSTKWIAQEKKEKSAEKDAFISVSDASVFRHPLAWRDSSEPFLVVGRAWSACTMNVLYVEESKTQLSLWRWWCILHNSFSPHSSYVCMVFAVQPSSVSAYLLITICWAIKRKWSLWPEDFYTAVQDLRAFENIRCCANNSNRISGISCHLINVRKLSIASMIYGYENTEWFVE